MAEVHPRARIGYSNFVRLKPDKAVMHPSRSRPIFVTEINIL